MKSILEFMDKLLLEVHSLKSLNSAAQNGDQSEFDQKYTLWLLSVKQILKHACLDAFLTEYHSTISDEYKPVWDLPRVAGILESAHECLAGGFTGQLKHLLHAEMFDSSVAQAKALLETGHRIPAAVLCRIVIEGWLRDQGEKAGVTNWNSAKASAVNDGLKTAGVFSTSKWRLIQSLMDIGNAAAHGSDGEFTTGDVERMIDFAEANCI